MLPSESKYRSRRPLRIAILGAPGVGKTSIALQYITKQVIVDSSPTTIEDVYRKDVNIHVTDDDALQRIHSVTNRNDRDSKMLLENDNDCDVFENEEEEQTPTELNLSLKITDTAGYIRKQEEQRQPRSFLSRLTLRRKPDHHKIQSKAEAAARRRSSSSVSSVPVKDRHAASMMNCDGVLLVYSVLDYESFMAARDLRDRLVKLHLENDLPTKQERKCMQLIFNKLSRSSLGGEEQKKPYIPPVFLVGTHADIRIEKMAHEKSSRIYDVSFLRTSDNRDRRGGNRKRKLAKSPTAGRGSVYPHDVYPVISEWKECAGFAEITSHDYGLVEQIFDKLNIAIVTSVF